MKNQKHACILTTLMLSVLAANCGDDVVGNTSEVGNSTVSVVVSNPGGTPAAGALVRLLPHDYDPQAREWAGSEVRDSSVCDSSGECLFEVPPGLYNVLAEGDSGSLYHDSVIAEDGVTTTVRGDTLGASGSLSGVVALAEGGDVRTASVLFMGTDRWTTVDSVGGEFTMEALPAGDFWVRVQASLDGYASLDTSVRVTGRRMTVLSDTLWLRP